MQNLRVYNSGAMRFYSIIISAVLIVIFIVQLIFPQITDMFLLNSNSLAQPWRFATAMFLHGSFSHLLMNLFALLLFGSILEKKVGSRRFLGIFFISGILANIIAFNFYDSSLGASGAIMGIIGTLAVLSPTMAVWAFGMVVPMIVAAVIWIIIDAVGIFMPDNIGHIAHLSGIIFGAMFGFMIRINTPKQKKKTQMIEVPEHLLRRWETLYMGRD
ncbi:rhomboid family intramembrane serine protease [Candidatus Pacearchaeota archaeon]|nr:rhomboid family intramembrane serine protease [Candidatus Pacearchaeota archaeon]